MPTPALPEGARALARGGAGRADAVDAAGGAASLAAASLVPRYELWTGAELGSAWGVRAGALDSRTAGYTLGAGYGWSTATHAPVPAHLPGWRVPGTSVDETTRWQDAWVGLAVPFGGGGRGGPADASGAPAPSGPRTGSLAAVGRWVRTDSSLVGAASGVVLDVAGAWQPAAALVLAAGAEDLLARGGPDGGRRATLGVAWRPSTAFGLVADGWAPWGQLRGAPDLATGGGGVGLDAGAVEGARFMLGGGWDAVPLVSAGAGVRSESLDLDVGVRLRDPAGARAWTSVTDLRLRF